MVKPTVKAVLTRANELLTETSWAKGSLAKVSQNGLSVSITDNDAACFCSIGAIALARLQLEKPVDMSVAAHSFAYDYARPYTQPFMDCLPARDIEDLDDYVTTRKIDDRIICFNDDAATEFADVKKAFACAIDAAHDAPPSDQPETVTPDQISDLGPSDED